jgi:hypothetical protein
VTAEVVRGKGKIGSAAFWGAVALHLVTAVAAVWMFTKAASS